MRQITNGMSQWRAQQCDGESLYVSDCKGGCFSVLPDFGLRVEGATEQDGVPTLDNPLPIRCVAAGSIVRICGADGSTVSQCVVPCDLHAGDVWFPMTGVVERRTAFIRLPFSGMNNGEYYPGWTTSEGELYDFCVSVVGIDKDTYILKSDMNSCSVESNHNYLCSINTMNGSSILYISRSWIGNAYTQSWWQTAHGDTFFELVCERKIPIIERYAPQPIFAPHGTVNILQTPADLSAQLSTTMMVRR